MKKIFTLSFIFFTLPIYGEVVNDFTNMCGIYHYMYAVPRLFTCSQGQFLPADSYICANCPVGYNCSGGTYNFNPKKMQGLEKNQNSPYISGLENNTCAANIGHVLNAVFTINTYDCAPGYYLQANTNECTICPASNYCPGGTYTFNETIAQGIEPCPSGMISLAGASACYPHILHVGEDIIYLKPIKTSTPSMHFSIDNEIFYANMTTIPTHMNSMSEHYLKVSYDNNVYYVCDDTTCGE